MAGADGTVAQAVKDLVSLAEGDLSFILTYDDSVDCTVKSTEIRMKEGECVPKVTLDHKGQEIHLEQVGGNALVWVAMISTNSEIYPGRYDERMDELSECAFKKIVPNMSSDTLVWLNKTQAIFSTLLRFWKDNDDKTLYTFAADAIADYDGCQIGTGKEKPDESPRGRAEAESSGTRSRSASRERTS